MFWRVFLQRSRQNHGLKLNENAVLSGENLYLIFDLYDVCQAIKPEHIRFIDFVLNLFSFEPFGGRLKRCFLRTFVERNEEFKK